jgi:hypothetical protein
MTVSSEGILFVQATDEALIGNTYTVSVQNTITIDDNGGTLLDEFAPVDADDKIEFTITLEDGCKAATINSPTFSSSILSVVDGETDSITFIDASDSFGEIVPQTDFCGRREYEVQFQSDSTVVSWVTVELT